jgi:hypothetical protein
VRRLSLAFKPSHVVPRTVARDGRTGLVPLTQSSDRTIPSPRLPSASLPARLESNCAYKKVDICSGLVGLDERSRFENYVDSQEACVIDLSIKRVYA